MYEYSGHTNYRDKGTELRVIRCVADSDEFDDMLVSVNPGPGANVVDTVYVALCALNRGLAALYGRHA